MRTKLGQRLRELRQRIIASGRRTLTAKEIDEMSDEGMYCRSCGVWVEWSDWIIRKDNDYCPHCNGPLCNETELEAVKLLDATFDLESLPRWRPFIPPDGYQRPMSEQIWLRIGEQDDYDQYDGIEEAAEALRECGVNGVDGWTQLGFEYGELSGLNYVSCYWGDGDAQAIRGLSIEEKAQLIRELTGVDTV